MNTLILKTSAILNSSNAIWHHSKHVNCYEVKKNKILGGKMKSVSYITKATSNGS